MRLLRMVLFASLAACSVSAAWAQYGLYGSPEMLRLPNQGATEQWRRLPSTAAPMIQPPRPRRPTCGARCATATTRRTIRRNRNIHRAMPPPQYRYPAQPPATAMYQPYQPGAHIAIPVPTVRPWCRPLPCDPAVAEPADAGPPPIPAGALPAMGGLRPRRTKGPSASDLRRA